MNLLTVETWWWGNLFGPEYVNRLRAMVERNLHVPHRFMCVTNQPHGLHPKIEIVPMPMAWSHTPRCRRRMWQFDRERVAEFGPRFLHIDLDTVITGDITAIVDRPEPLVCWRAHYANVVSPAFMLMDTGYLHELWERFRADPEGYPLETGVKNASDLAMLNYYLEDKDAPAFWDERDGFVAYFGSGYERLEYLGVGPSRPILPQDTRVVMLGGADKHVMDAGSFPWIRAHWHEREAVPA